MATKAGKKKGSMFLIDCTKPVEDKIMGIASFEIAGGKSGAFGDAITLSCEKTKITLSQDGKIVATTSSK